MGGFEKIMGGGLSKKLLSMTKGGVGEREKKLLLMMKGRSLDPPKKDNIIF